MRLRTILSILAVVAAGSGCLPGRDNPYDPANAPVAALAIRDASGSEQLGTVSRGLPLALDGTASSDPQGRYECFFELVEPTSLARDIAEDGCYAPLGDLQRELVVGTNLTFRLTVRDDSGGQDEADARIQLSNARPTASAGPPRTLPAGGFPWAPGQSFTVPFLAQGTDPDSDPLLYCWRFPGEDQDVCSVDPADPQFVRTLPPTPGRYVATLTVHDNDPSRPQPIRLASHVSTTRVVVGARNLWTATDDQGVIERLDGARETLVPGGALDAAVEVGAALTGDRLVYVYDANADPVARSNEVRSIPAGDPLDVPPTDIAMLSAGAGPFGLGADPARGRVWVRQGTDATNIPGCPQPSGAASVVAVLDAATLTTLGCTSLDRPVLGHARIYVDASGGAYVPEELGNGMAYVDSSGTLVVDDLLTGDDVLLGFGVRPGTDEGWGLVIPYNTTGEGSAQIAVFRRGTDGVPAEVGRIGLGVGAAFGVGWTSRDELWMHVSGTGMFRLDARVLESFLGVAEPALSAAAIEVLPGGVDITDLVVDPVSYACWAGGHATGGLYRGVPGGQLAYFAVAEPPAEPLAVDEQSRLLFTTPGKLHRGTSPSEDGVVVALPLFSAAAPEADVETGGLWVSLLLPPALAQVAEDGSIVRLVGAVEFEKGVVPPPLVRLFRLAPGRETAFAMSMLLPAFDPGPVFRVDLDREPVLVTAIMDSASAVQLAARGSVLEPSAPVAGQEPFLWTVLGSGGESAVVRLDFDGAPVGAPFPIPAAEAAGIVPPDPKLRAARSLATNSLCLATVVGGAQDSLMLRRISVAMAVTQLDTTPDTLPAGYELVAIAAMPDTTPGGPNDVCWVAYRSPSASTLMAFRTPASAPLRVYNGPPGITSIAPVSLDEVWITQEDAPGVVSKVRLTTTTTVLSVNRTLAPSSPNVLVRPEARGKAFAPPGPQD